MIAVTIPIIVLLLLAVIILSIYCYRMKQNLILMKQELGFFNVPEVTVDEESTINFSQEKSFPSHLEIPKEAIELGEVIGSSGSFGRRVHRAKLLNQHNVVVKTPGFDYCNKTYLRNLLYEIRIFHYLSSHPNIVTFMGAYTKEIRKGIVYVVTEYCENGALQNYLRDLQQRQEDVYRESKIFSVDLSQLYRFSKEIASGMKYIAEKAVIHGDLASRNILLTSDYTCKISDFGLSKRLYDYTEYVKKTQEPLPWRWMAPETLRAMVFSTNSDMWGYGVTLWEIFSLGVIPYPGLTWSSNFVTILNRGMRMENPQHASDDLYNKMLECWNRDPGMRPSFADMETFFSGLLNEQVNKLQ